MDRPVGWPEQARSEPGPPSNLLALRSPTVLQGLNAWRNYLVHGDEKARTALRAALKAQGHGDFADDAEVISLLSSDYAATVIERAEAAFILAVHHTGVQAPFPRGAWISPSEGAARHRSERLRHGA